MDISVAVETKGGPLSVLLKNVNTCSLWDIALTMQVCVTVTVGINNY